MACHGARDITIRHDVHALSTFFKYAISHHWASTNPIREIEIPSDAEAQRMHVLTIEEEEDYFRSAERFPDLHDVGRLMINQGLRPEEATTLAKDDINLETGMIHVPRKDSCRQSISGHDDRIPRDPHGADDWIVAMDFSIHAEAGFAHWTHQLRA